MSYNTNIVTKSKVVALEIDIGLRNDMVRFIKERIMKNLQAIKQFLQLNVKEYDDICAGLYTYAVEEYGKILYLTNLSASPSNNKVKIRYTHDNHGFLDHDHKFDLALKALPNSCRVLRGGGFTTTGFTPTGFTQDTTADFETRMSVFYANFDKNNNYNSILRPIEVDRDLLVNAVEDFLAFMRQQKYP
jgi:hypothetical protein